MPTIAVCDDNAVDIKRITALVKKWAQLQQSEEIYVKAFVSSYALLDAVSRGEPLDIFLLDILMPEMTGISLGEQLQSLLAEPLMIYLTSSEDYYSDAFRLYAFQYICKPVSEELLFPVLDKALSRCEKRKNDLFLLKTAQGVVQIALHTIVYAELRAHICHFHLSNGACLQSLYLRSSFDNFIQPLLQQERFIKTHTSFVVNLDFATKLTASTLFLTSGMNIPVSRSFAIQVQRSYISYGLREEGDVSD